MSVNKLPETKIPNKLLPNFFPRNIISQKKLPKKFSEKKIPKQIFPNQIFPKPNFLKKKVPKNFTQKQISQKKFPKIYFPEKKNFSKFFEKWPPKDPLFAAEGRSSPQELEKSRPKYSNFLVLYQRGYILNGLFWSCYFFHFEWITYWFLVCIVVFCSYC